jgi:acetyltransferase-like isoleucine patch superfamily enzyme
MSTEKEFIGRIDQQRASQGFLTVSELLDLSKEGTIIFDPFSVLVSSVAIFGRNNTFYPNVIVQIKDGGEISLGDDNIFYPNTIIIADTGKVFIGNSNQFGDGGCTLKANMANKEITVGDKGRYINGALIIGGTSLGSGSQVIGPITVQDCTLEPGDDYRSSRPEFRAGLLKGYGLARAITVSRGNVLNGSGVFRQEDIEDQAKYHPKH